MDAHAWEEQNNIRKNENQYQLSLARAATGDMAAASRTGLLAQRADPTSSLYQDPSQDPSKPVGLTGLAGGGLAQARRPYLVGEKGPELIVPKEAGTVIPNHKISKLLMLLRKKKAVVPRAEGGDLEAGGDLADAVPRAEGGDMEAGGAPPNMIAALKQVGIPDSVPVAPAPAGIATTPAPAPVPVTPPVALAPAAPVAAAAPVPVTPAAPAPATIAPTGAADLAAAAAIRPPGFTPIRTSQGGSMTLGTNDLGIQEIRTSHPSWQLYQSAGKAKDYPGAVANWRKEQDTNAANLAKAGLDAESHLEAARITKPYQNTQEGLQFLANAELKNPERVAKAETDRAAEATRVGETHVATVKNWLASNYGTFDNSTGQTTFKPTDPGQSQDALASQEVARRQGAPAAIQNFQERQLVRKYLTTVPLPDNFNSNAYLGAVSQNPAAWQELVAKGKALNVTRPAESVPSNQTVGGQLGTLGRAITPNWMRPPQWGTPQ